MPYTPLLRNSKNSNSPRSFQSRTFKNKRVVTSNIRVILKPERSFQEILSPQTNILTYQLTNEQLDTMLILCFFDPPDSKTCKSAKNKKSKIFTIIKVHHTYYDGELKEWNCFEDLFVMTRYPDESTLDNFNSNKKLLNIFTLL